MKSPRFAFYLEATDNSPKVVIDLPALLFEVSGISAMSDPRPFYEQIFRHLDEHLHEVASSIYQRGEPQLTLHFYLRYAAMADLLMLRQLDKQLSGIQLFKTYIYWYYNPDLEDTVDLAREVSQTFLNPVRLIYHSLKE